MNTPYYTNNNFYMLQQQIRQVIQYLGISNNIRFMLQRGFQIGQIQQQMQVQWVSRVMNTQQVAQFIQFRGYTWNQVQEWVIQEIQQQIINVNQTIMNQQMMNVTNAMMGNLPSMMMNTTNMMMRQPVTTQNKLNNTQIQGNLPSIQTTPNVVNQLPLSQMPNNNINLVPENSINDPIKGYLEDIKDYVQNKMQSLLNEDNLKDQDWETLVGIQLKLSTVLDSPDKSVGDYLKYSECIDKFFEYWQEITERKAGYNSFLNYVAKYLSGLKNSQLINSTQPPKKLQAKDLLNTKKRLLNNGGKTQRSKLAKRYNAFVAIGDTYEKQDISGLRKYLTQLHSWIQEEYNLIGDNNTNAEEMELFCNVCRYYANVTKCFLNFVSRDYDEILDLNDELFTLYHDKFEKIKEENNDNPDINGYVARKLHWLKMNFDSSSPAMLMVAKQFAYYRTDSNKHIRELQGQLPNFKDGKSFNNLDINTNTNGGADKGSLEEVVRLVNTLNADIERISVSDLAQRATANQARDVAAASLAKVRGMCEEKTKADKFKHIMRLPKSVEIRSNFFTGLAWLWYCIKRFFNGETSLAENSLTNEASRVIKDQLNNVLSDNNIKLLSLGFLSQYKINAVLMQNSQWLAGNVIKPYLAKVIKGNDVIRGCQRKVLEAFYNIVPTANIPNNQSFNGVKYGLFNLVSNVLGVTVNQTIFEFLEVSASECIKHEDRALDYLSTAEIAAKLEEEFTDNQEKRKKLQSDIGKLFVDKFETNLKNEFSNVLRVIEQTKDLSIDHSRKYKCNDGTISDGLFELNQKYIEDNINSVDTGATFGKIFKNYSNFDHRNDFLSKVKFNLKGYGASELRYLNSLQENFLSNLSLDHESEYRKELDNIKTRKQAKEMVEQKQKQQNKNDANNINNDILEDDDIEEEEKNENTKVTLNKIDIDKFVRGDKSFYCSESTAIIKENGKNKEEDKPNNNYPDYSEFELSKPGLTPGLIDDRDLNDDSNLDSDSAPAITTFGGPIDGSEVEENNLETPNMASRDDEGEMFTNNLEEDQNKSS